MISRWRALSVLAAAFVVFLASKGLVASFAQVSVSGPACVSPYRIDWPSPPVWSFCWRAPQNSSGVAGSGLELYDVFYKGRRLLWTTHLPVLNVKYDPGGCGGDSLSYRDWQNSPIRF